MYTKDLVSLLKLLSISGQTGVLLIEPPANGEDERLWYAQILLVEGQVRTSQIQHKGQLFLRDAEALNWLSGQRGLIWTLEEKSKQELLPPSTSPSIRIVASKSALGSKQGAPQEINSSDEKTQQYPSDSERNMSTTVPRRTAQGKQAEINPTWSRDYRSVFALVDGRRTLKEIASLLKKTPEHVQRVINDFRKVNLIE